MSDSRLTAAQRPYILVGMKPHAASAPTRRQPDRTRQRLLEAAFEEIHRSGFRSASLDAILRKAGVTKGALYHHFRNKTELGYAVVDEVVRPWVEARWKPVAEAQDCIGAAIATVRRAMAERSEIGLAHGCPFNNLCQEMSGVDEGFRERLTRILDEWVDGVADAIRRAQRAGQVRRDVDPQAAAAFVVASIEGSIGMAKAACSRRFLEQSMQGLIEYIEALRADAPAQQGKQP